MNDASITLVYTVLLAAGHPPERARWMAESCPSIARAKELAAIDRRNGRYAVNSKLDIPESAVLVGELHKKWSEAKCNDVDTFIEMHRALEAHYYAMAENAA